MLFLIVTAELPETYNPYADEPSYPALWINTLSKITELLPSLISNPCDDDEFLKKLFLTVILVTSSNNTAFLFVEFTVTLDIVELLVPSKCIPLSLPISLIVKF